jgi:hypothetical protein
MPSIKLHHLQDPFLCCKQKLCQTENSSNTTRPALGWFSLGVGIGPQAYPRRVCAKYQVAPPSGFFYVLQTRIMSD